MRWPFDEARREHRDIVVVGRSLGSGVAVRVASFVRSRAWCW
jgi:hypothetical protein